jgi:MFS family permease
VAVVFFVNGAVMANWVARVPAIKDRVGAGTGSLGVALLGIAVGSLVTLPVSGRLCERYSSRRVVTVSGLALAGSLFLLSLAPNVVTLAVALTFFGGSFGLLDVAMNVQAVAVVRSIGRPIMPLFHAGFSGGGLFGAACGGVAASVGLTPVSHFAIAATVAAVSVLAARRALLPDRATPEPEPALLRDPGPAPRVPLHRRIPLPIVGLGLIAACAALCEGAMADWTALFLRDVRGLDAGAAALGFAAFSVTMTVGRLFGATAIARLGPVRVVRLGGAASAAGVVAAVVATPPAVALVGFALVGAGMCCVYPLALSTAGESSDGSGGREIATVSVIGYSGFLIGPPVVGLLAEAVGLRDAMLAVAVPALALVGLAAVLHPAVRPEPELPSSPVAPPAQLRG